MSFEGYYQVLCRNGHQSGADCGYCGFDDPGFTPQDQQNAKYDESDDPPLPDMWKCSACGEVAGWWNLVDDTNCDEAGKVSFVEVSPAEYQTCNLGHQHTIKEATYKPAEEGGHFVNGGLK